MPGKRSAAATADGPGTEAPVVAPAINGTAEHELDDDGLEKLPHFQVPAGVRPSERCGSPSPLGISCEFSEHLSGRHSWQPEQADNAKDDDAETQQTELPGIPAGSILSAIPYESQFNAADFQSAPLIKDIAEQYIDSIEEFAHLRGIEMRYFWKRRGGLKGGTPRLAALQKPGGLTAFALGRPQFVLWVAADHCRDAKLTDEQMHALVFDRLCNTAVDPDDHSAFRVTGCDFEGNILTIQRFGFWHPDLRELGANVKQLGLLDSITDDEVEALDDQDDGEEGEGEGGE